MRKRRPRRTAVVVGWGMKWLKLLIPPEWDFWAIRDRVAYFVFTALGLGLMVLGARQVGQMAAAWVRSLLGQ